jgi:hypothetical protein
VGLRQGAGLESKSSSSRTHDPHQPTLPLALVGKLAHPMVAACLLLPKGRRQKREGQVQARAQKQRVLEALETPSLLCIRFLPRCSLDAAHRTVHVFP